MPAATRSVESRNRGNTERRADAGTEGQAEEVQSRRHQRRDIGCVSGTDGQAASSRALNTGWSGCNAGVARKKYVFNGMADFQTTAPPKVCDVPWLSQALTSVH